MCVCVCVIRDAVASPARQPGQMTGADVESSSPEQNRKLNLCGLQNKSKSASFVIQVDFTN